MNINCISCGHRFDLGKSYDDYEGLVKCSTCRAMLDIRTEDGQVRRVRPFVSSQASSTSELASTPIMAPTVAVTAPAQPPSFVTPVGPMPTSIPTTVPNLTLTGDSRQAA